VTTLEKLMLLKRVNIFSTLSGEDLAEIAAITEELEVSSGQEVIREGEVDSSLFVVVDGSVRVHKAGQTLAELGPSEVFGELALLDPAPRNATVSAASEVTLLRIEGDAFEDVAREKHEISRGILRVLARRLRLAGSA
jgi:CRP-like cAMP-binding protein